MRESNSLQLGRGHVATERQRRSCPAMPAHIVILACRHDAPIWLQALQGRLVVPDWEAFTANVTTIYDLVKRTEFGGKNADYIPVLHEQVKVLGRHNSVTLDPPSSPHLALQ